MRKLLQLAVMWTAVAACSDRDPVTDPDLHRIVPCSAAWAPWGVPERCETACAEPPANYTPSSGGREICEARLGASDGDLVVDSCYESELFEYEGARGCCRVGGGPDNKPVAYFAVCVRDL